MGLTVCKRVYIGRGVLCLFPFGRVGVNHVEEQLEPEVVLSQYSLQQLDDQGQVVKLVQYSQQVDQQSSIDHENCGGGRGGGGRRKALNIEEKKIRKRQNDAKYRINKRVEYEKLKEDNNMLRNSLTTLIEQVGKQTHVPPSNFDELLHNLAESDHQPLAYPQDNIIQSSFSVVPSDESQRTLSVVVQNDARKYPEENLLTEHKLFMEKLEQDERSNVCYSDLKTILQGETQDVDGYRIPLVLLPIYEKIVASYGDITRNCLLSPFSAENILLQFLATIKGMEDTWFEQVTEELIFKWRDCIAEARRINFNVAFATQHLKKIAKSYLARKACNELSSIDNRMQALETEYNDLRKERLKKQEVYPPQLLAASEDFPTNVGLF